MKRWQARGEVADSEEDEDLSLDIDSPSPERPHKRAKHTQDEAVDSAKAPLSPAPAEDVQSSDDEDESNWIQAKVATTYGRRGKVSKQTSAPASRHETPNKVVESVQSGSVVSLDDQEVGNGGNTQKPRSSPPETDKDIAPTNSPPSAGLGSAERNLFASLHASAISQDVSSPRTTHTDANGDLTHKLCTVKQIVQPQLSASVLLKRPLQQEAGVAHALEGRPAAEKQPVAIEISTLPETVGDQSRAVDPPTPRNEGFLHLSDLLSSPLSEREVSPPPGFSVQRPDVSPASNDDADALSDAESLPRNVEDLGIDSLVSAANARRSFRARKEKQLHPYMYDKAQYQKQFRERGLKPVRVVEDATPNEESQSASHSAASQSSEIINVSSPMNQPLRDTTTAHLHLDYFNAASSSSDDEPGGHIRSAKRRKIENATRPGQLPTRLPAVLRAGETTVPDEYSIPPSPPRTSSDTGTPNVTARNVEHVVTGFRLPRGRIPIPPPTPQVSSDVRPRNVDMDSLRRSPPETSRTLRRESDILSPELSSSESEEESRAEAEAKRLRREQKRIKGVLPASWLRIDFRKQRVQHSPAPTARRRLSLEPPPSAEPQRGVARKITTARPRNDSSPGFEAIGGDSDDSDVSMRELTSLPTQSRLALENGRFSLNPSEAIDDDDMENDFIDPMLPGTSRPGKGHRRGPNQPRITDAFRKAPRMGDDFSEERVSSRSNAGKVSESKKRKRRRQARSRPSPARLSILDAPRSPSYAANELPQFVRLALRRIRGEPSRGRHSPTDKIVRLATGTETEEASSILRAWREGTIAPRRSPSPTRSEHPPQRGLSNTPVRHRVPLGHLSANGNQPRLRVTSLRKSTALTVQPHRMPTNGATRVQTDRLAIGDQTIEQETPDPLPDANARRRRPAMRIPAQHSRLRNGQLETLESEFDQTHRSAAFERRMQYLTENIALPERRSRAPGFQLSRFLHANETDTPGEDAGDTTQHSAEARHPVLAHRARPRKPLARHVDTESRQYRQPSEALPDLAIQDPPTEIPVGISEDVLQGLGPFGTKYSVDFDVQPLGPGTFFQHTTFIGSGEFGDALNLAKRNLSCAAGHMRVQLDGEMLEWGGWNEDVAANLARIPKAVSEALQTLEINDAAYDRRQQLSAVDSNIDYLLRSVVRYCSKCLHFVDAVDRQSCAESLCRLVVDLKDATAEPTAAALPLPQTMAKMLQYALVITKQASQISEHHVVPAATKTQIDDLLSLTAKQLANSLVVGHFEELRSFYEDNRHAVTRAAGIDGNAYLVSSIVILNNIMPATGFKSLLWPAIFSKMGTEFGQTCAVGNFERLWYDLFSLLPALEFTSAGTVSIGSRLLQPQEDWSLPQTMLSRAFALYERSSDIRGYSVNDYVRALLFRCYTLVNKWGWWRCESVLNVIYDFFSRRGLALLKKEDSRGSPKFLDELGGGHVSLEVQNDDRSFHIFLKILASGLLGMSKYQLYGDRKIQGIAWRFIPNHNRTYRKDIEVERSTLDALRNHHDLICTLYYASPPGHRPGVHLLRELVDHSTSHREACRLNVRAWANIASFQASTSESLEVLRPLTTWFTEIMKTTMAQYRLAKSEAQQAFDLAKLEGANPAESLLESTVARNQRQIAATIVDALAGLKRALRSASSLAVGTFLVEETTFWTIFELFDPSQRRLISAMTEALQVVDIALDIEQRPTSTPESQIGSDDSQDFGDSDALQEFAANEKTSPDNTTIVETLLGPVGQFMSNVVGADVSPDDDLLQRAVDIWVRLAGNTVKTAKKSWLSYVDDYSINGWGQMRNTAQKRKFTSYFMSRIVEQSSLDDECHRHITTAWLLSLVEREALLKFQHMLTAALLNHSSNDRLLQNLPFAKDHTGDFHITLTELRQRRLALISSVLCNMREDCERNQSRDVRVAYEGMLRRLMQAMKSNYHELQRSHEASVADATVQGAYVEFVQQVVSFLQQHTTDICKVDSFFTDSTAFPLPSDDPTYVVGRLRGYIPKLHEPPTRKRLAGFVQSVSERAAVDGQQPYLVNQMFTAMRGIVEHGDRASPSLRHLLLTTIFPAYVENAFATACSWVLVLPILQACERILPDLLYSVKIDEEASVIAANESAIAVLHGINQQVEKILGGFPEMLGLAHVLQTLAAMLRVGTSCLTFVSFVKRTTSHGGELMKQVLTLRELSVDLEARLQGGFHTGMFEASVVANPPACPWPDTKTFAENSLQDGLNQYWHVEDGRYYWKRSGRTQEAVVSLQDSAGERERLLRTAGDFRIAYDATFSARVRRRQQDAGENRWMNTVIV